MSAQNPKAYHKDLGQFAVDLFQNPLSEWTIKRQNNLLITSVITTLLAFHVLKFLEVSVGPQGKAAIPSERAALIILTLITTYNFVAYLLSVVQDYKLRKYKKLLLRIRYDQMQAPGLEALPRLLAKAFAKQRNSGKGQTQIFNSRLKEREELDRKYNDQISSLLFADLIGGERFPEPGEIETLQQEQAESLRTKDEEIAKLTSKKKELNAEINNQIETSLDRAARRVNDAGMIVKSSAKLDKYRLLLEVIFPLVVALFSIVVSVRSVIRGS